MPILDLQDAQDLDRTIERLLDAPDPAESLRRLQAVFVERLDFNPASGSIRLRAEGLPDTAERIAERDGVNVVAVHDGETLIKQLEQRNSDLWLVAMQHQEPVQVDERTRIVGVVRQAAYRP